MATRSQQCWRATRHTARWSLNANGSYTYTPDQDYNGADSFTYRASDGTLFSNVATVSLVIHPVNDAPVAGNYAEPGVPEDTPWVASAPGVLNLVYDVENDPLTAKVGTPPAHGALDLKPDGGFEYTPALNYYGPDSFTYIANDGQADSNAGTVTHHGQPDQRRAGGRQRQRLLDRSGGAPVRTCTGRARQRHRRGA